MVVPPGLATQLYVPFLKTPIADLSWGYIPFIVFTVIAIANSVNIADGIAVLQYLFQGGAAPSCLDACDLDDNGQIGVGDAVGVFNYQFAGGAPPAAPFPTGPDTRAG